MIHVHTEIGGMFRDVDFNGSETELIAMLGRAGFTLSVPPGQVGPISHLWLTLPDYIRNPTKVMT